MLKIEREALELALAGRDIDAPRAAPGRVLAEQRLNLAEEQRRLVREATMSADRVVCIVGVAGAGKTTALRVVNDVFADAGVPVLGAAPSGRAADELETATAIRSSTMHRLLLDARREGGLPQHCVLVVDEAGMADTRVLEPLLRLTDDAHGKAILVGDPQQLPSVGAGGLYSALCERLGSTHLTQNRRQHDLGEKIALARLRNGDAEPYLAHAAARGRLQLVDDPLLAKRRLLEDWWHWASRDLDGTIMLAHRRDDVRELNDAARVLMLGDGRLGNIALTLGDRDFRVGDRVLCRRNDSGLGVRNGTRGTVVELDLRSQSLTMRAEGGSLHRLSTDYSRDHLEHGYALTGHAAQGATVERAFVLLHDHRALREWGYVACTRARRDTRLYVAREAMDNDVHARNLDTRAQSEHVARALERSAAEPLALDQTAPRADEYIRASKKLAAAQRELEELNWWNRGHRRGELQAEVARWAATLRAAEETRTQVERIPPATPRLPVHCRAADELAATRRLRPHPSRGRTLEGEPPGLEL